MHDLITPGAEEQDYTHWLIEEMKIEIGNRSSPELDVSKPKNQLITMLKLSDIYAIVFNDADEE